MLGLHVLTLQREARRAEDEIARLLIQQRDIQFAIDNAQSRFGGARWELHKLRQKAAVAQPDNSKEAWGRAISFLPEGQ